LAFYGSDSKSKNNFGATEVDSFNDTLANVSERTIKDGIGRRNVSGHASGRVQIGGRPDRVLSLSGELSKADAVTDGFLYSANRFYQSNGGIQSVDTIDERVEVSDHSLKENGTLGFTEPLWRGGLLGLSYTQYYGSEDPLQATFDRGDGKYTNVVDSLTSYFSTHTASHNCLVTVQGKTDRINYTLGMDWVGYSYRQEDMLKGSSVHLHYSNFAPRVSCGYTPNASINFNFNYIVFDVQPTIAQLAPTLNSSDPLHITLGNPYLKPGFTQYFRLAMHYFDTWLINVDLDGSLANNSISTKVTTDSLGRQITQPVDVEGEKKAGLNLTVSRKVFGIDVGFHTAFSYDRTLNYINTDLCRNDAFVESGGFGVSKYAVDKYSLQFNTTFAYFDQVSSVNSGAPVRYWTQNHQGAITLFFVRHFEFNTNASYTWQERTSTFSANASVLLWNTYISRNLAHDKLVIKVQVNNLLDSNAGISRTSNNNINEQTSSNILGRYWVLSVAWHFDHTFKRK